MMIVTAIMGVVAFIAPKLYIQIQRFFFMSSAHIELQRDARTSMSILSRRIRQARSETIVVDRASSQPYYSRLSFTDIHGNNVKFYQQGKLLQMVDVSTTTLSENLRFLSFSVPRSDDLSIISVSLTLEKVTFEKRTKALHMASEKVRIMN